MKGKSALLIINPRRGKNVARLADLLAVFSAAGWKTDTALKEFARAHDGSWRERRPKRAMIS